MASLLNFEEPSVDGALALFKAIENKFPHKTVGDNKWYLVVLSALAGSSEPEHVGTLYKYLIEKPEFSTSASRKLLMQRLREGLVKCVSIIGVCKPLEAVFAITSFEREEDKDYSFSREHWQSGPENHSRGMKWMDQIFMHNQAKTDNTLSAQKDFIWICQEITYGLFLSDHTIFSPIDTEMVVLSGIMIQNLPKETGWHLRGTRRIGVSFEDVELIQQCIEMVAKFSNLRLHKVPRVKDIENEV